MLMSRSEFLTPYTPYQPEVSQGGLQVMFEYQTAISELTALPVANASVYDGPSAVASAGYLARIANGRTRFVVSEGLHPHARETLRTYARGFGAEIVEVPLRDGVTDPDAWARRDGRRHLRRLLPEPQLPRRGRGRRRARRPPCTTRSPTPSSSAPTTRSRWASCGRPASAASTSCVGEGQPLGNRLDYGGPSFGFFAATEEYLRRMPGRIAGETVDADGRRGFVLTLQTREQHIRREKATSNICTAQALNALGGVVYLPGSGARGSSSSASCCCSARTTRARRCARSTASWRCTTSR